MQRFHFRLERVRQWQSKMCTEAEEKLRDSLHSLGLKDQALAGLRAEFQAAEEGWRQVSILNTADLRAWSAFRHATTRKERSLTAARVEASQAVERQRDELIRARRRLQMLDKLRERALSAHQLGVERELEEVAMTAHLHSVEARLRP